MVTSTIKNSKQIGVQKIGLISYTSNSTWEYPDPTVTKVHLGDNWQSWKAKLRFARICSDYDLFLVLGADVLDGHYSVLESVHRLSLISVARGTGAAAIVLGFSFNDHPAIEVTTEMRRLPADVRFYARDPISKQNLERCLDRSIIQAADVAFLLESRDDTDYVHNVRRWAQKERSEGRTLLGINANYLHASRAGSVTNLAVIYSGILCYLSEHRSDLSFVLIPHDARSDSNDITLLDAIFSSLPDSIQDHCLCLEMVTASEVKAICKLLDMVCSGRMHLAIACLSQSIPVACLAYQGKFEGLYELFGLDGLVVAPEKAFQLDFLGEYLHQLIDRKEEIAHKITEGLPEVTHLAEKNFECLFTPEIFRQ